MHLACRPLFLIVACGCIRREPGITLCYFLYIFSMLCQAVAWKLLGQETASVLVLRVPEGSLFCSLSQGFLNTFFFQLFINLQKELALNLEEPRSKGYDLLASDLLLKLQTRSSDSCNSHWHFFKKYLFLV